MKFRLLLDVYEYVLYVHGLQLLGREEEKMFIFDQVGFRSKNKIGVVVVIFLLRK